LSRAQTGINGGCGSIVAAGRLVGQAGLTMAMRAERVFGCDE
jgi:hypothetical protein